MIPHRFELIDVFCDGPFSGNPLAVVTTPDELDAAQMQRITGWLNLSETAFLLPPTDPAADYRVRIFTLERELPFAGHPTLGACHAWLQAGGVAMAGDTIIQQCGIGRVAVRRFGERLAFAAPLLIRSGEVADDLLDEVLCVLGIGRAEVQGAAWVDNGPGWIGVQLSGADAVLALKPARSHPRRIEIGVVGLHPPGGAAAYEVRAFFSDAHGGIIEDPVTGSLNASLAQWLTGSGQVTPPFMAAQGTCLGRDGRVHIDADETGHLWIGGLAVTRVSGMAQLA